MADNRDIEDGGPAFPPDSIYSMENRGATIRDLYFMAALTGLLSNHGHNIHSAYDSLVCQAFNYADEALRQREAKP